MAPGQEESLIYLVPVVDVNWLVYAPFDPGRNFRVDPPNVVQSIKDTSRLNAELRNLVDGKFVLTPHSGTYCRTGYYEGEILDVYGEAMAGGAEIAVHLHEEIKGVGTRYADWDHVSAMFNDCKARLKAFGIHPVAYRGGHYAYHPFMNRLLEENEIYADYSACPGMNYPEREAVWTEAAMSAAYLPENPRAPWAGQHRSNVLEIPIGSDGLGSAYENILHVEQSELDNLTRVWDAIVARAKAEGKSQVVHCLFHTASVGEPKWLERYCRFLEMVPRRHGQFVTTIEAREIHGRLTSEFVA
jgi:hypothetical protein